MAEHRIKKGAKKVAKVVGDIATGAAGEALGKVATSGVERTEQRLFEGKPRGRLLTLLSEMPDGDTENLWRHHQEVLEDDDPMAEDRFIHNLIKLLGEGEGADDRCKKVLKYLNGLEDDQFKQAIELLEHDAVAQILQKIKLHGWETVRDILIKVAEAAEEAFDKANEVVSKLDDGAEKLADRLENWLDENTDDRGVLRPRKEKKS